MTTTTTERAGGTALQEALVQKRKGRIFLETSAAIVSSVKEKYHLTQSQLAELLGVTQSYISRVERGERKLTLVHLETLSKCLDLPMAVFLWRTLGSPRSASLKKKQLFARMEALLKRAYPDSRE